MEAQCKQPEDVQRSVSWIGAILARMPGVPKSSPLSKRAEKKPSSLSVFKNAKFTWYTTISEKPKALPKQNGAIELTANSKQKSLPAREDFNGSTILSNDPTASDSIKTPPGEDSDVNAMEPAEEKVSNASERGPVPEMEPQAIDTTAHSNPPNVHAETQKRDMRKHVKKITRDCYVDLAHTLSPEIQRIWDNKIHRRLVDTLAHSAEGQAFTVECVMSTATQDEEMELTILIMCLNLAHKKLIEETYRKASFIPKEFRRRVVVLGFTTCATRPTHAVIHGKDLSGESIQINIDKAADVPVLFGNLCRMYSDLGRELSPFCTMGGVISINERFYGLTVTHSFGDFDISLDGPPIPSGDSILLVHGSDLDSDD